MKKYFILIREPANIGMSFVMPVGSKNVNVMICHKCGKVVLWEKMIVDKGTGKRVYHIQCWDRDEEK